MRQRGTQFGGLGGVEGTTGILTHNFCFALADTSHQYGRCLVVSRLVVEMDTKTSTMKATTTNPGPPRKPQQQQRQPTLPHLEHMRRYNECCSVSVQYLIHLLERSLTRPLS